jgi:hypothetical protein
MPDIATRIANRVHLVYQRQQNNAAVRRFIRQVQSIRPLTTKAQKPVVLFNASTRLTGISLNAGFALLTRLGLELEGIPVEQFVCAGGMTRCVLGTDRTDPRKSPPCRSCLAQSRVLTGGSPARWFSYQADPALDDQLGNLSIPQLIDYEIAFSPGSPEQQVRLPLGRLCLPALRWVLRRHHLMDDELTRFLMKQYMLSAWNIARQFKEFLERVNPQAVIVFNGQFYPEATARWVAQQRGLPVITHEVGLRPFTAFFTPGEATAYPLNVPEEFELDERQNARLDAYLSQRFQGQFSMAGIRFWSAMQGLDPALKERIHHFRQVVPVFTNVIFDTSQPHSNVVFPHMFAWLDIVLDLARRHEETLFVIRAHPDESRPGKASLESVREWVDRTRAQELPNVHFIDSHEALSSYELIKLSKFVMIYNSTIGLEAAILGTPVLCAGRARFTQLPTVFFPPTQQTFTQQAEQFLEAETITTPPEFARNARRFLYYQLFYSSLPFAEYLEEDGIWPGFVRLRYFPAENLRAEHSPAIRTIVDGLLHGGSFLLKHDD